MVRRESWQSHPVRFLLNGGVGLHLQGPYVVTISVTNGPPDAAETADQLMCLEVDFDIAPPGARDVLNDITSGIKSKLHNGRRALI